MNELHGSLAFAAHRIPGIRLSSFFHNNLTSKRLISQTTPPYPPPPYRPGLETGFVRFISSAESVSTAWSTAVPRDCISTFSVCYSPRLHYPPTPQAITGLHGPLFPVGCSPNETDSHNLQRNMHPPHFPEAAEGALVHPAPLLFVTISPTHFLCHDEEIFIWGGRSILHTQQGKRKRAARKAVLLWRDTGRFERPCLIVTHQLLCSCSISLKIEDIYKENEA